MKKGMILALAALALFSCRHPEVEFVDFDTFKVFSVKSSDVFMPDGSLNPEIRVMEDPEIDTDTKIATTDANSIVRNILGEVNCNNIIHVAGTYKGHDVDGSELVQSGKLLLPICFFITVQRSDGQIVLFCKLFSELQLFGGVQVRLYQRRNDLKPLQGFLFPPGFIFCNCDWHLL